MKIQNISCPWSEDNVIGKIDDEEAVAVVVELEAAEVPGAVLDSRKLRPARTTIDREVLAVARPVVALPTITVDRIDLSIKIRPRCRPA